MYAKALFRAFVYLLNATDLIRKRLQIHWVIRRHIHLLIIIYVRMRKRCLCVMNALQQTGMLIYNIMQH